MIRPVKIDVQLGFDGRHQICTDNEPEQGLKEKLALLCLEGLIDANMCEPVRPLYFSSIEYRSKSESPGFVCRSECLRRGFGDASEIVAWRVADLRQTGIDKEAKPILKREWRGDGPGFSYYTVSVLRSNGRIEDPVAIIRGTRNNP